MSTITDTTTTATTLATPLTLPNGAIVKNRLVKAAMSEQLGAPRTSRPGNSRASTAAGPRRRRVHHHRQRHNRPALARRAAQRRRRRRPRPRTTATLGGRRQENGATALVRINHPGRQTPAGLSELAVAPSAVQLDMGPAFAKPRALTAEEIVDLVARFARTARTVVEAGFDGVQIHAAHGYLINQFLSPLSNRRDDDWGGDPERRCRFLLEVTRAVRAAIGPDKILAIKLNFADFQRGGFTENESLAVIEQLDRENIDLLEISGGTYESPAMSDGARPRVLGGARRSSLISRTVSALSPPSRCWSPVGSAPGPA